MLLSLHWLAHIDSYLSDRSGTSNMCSQGFKKFLSLRFQLVVGIAIVLWRISEKLLDVDKFPCGLFDLE